MAQNIKIKGAALRKIRDDKGYSRAQLAERTMSHDKSDAVSKVTIERMELMPDSVFRVAKAELIALALNCPLSALTNDADDSTPVVCSKITEGRDLYDLLRSTLDPHIKVEAEPSAINVQNAMLSLIRNIEDNVGRLRAIGSTSDTVEIQHRMRRDLETLAEADLYVHAGTYYRVEWFSVISDDFETVTWSGISGAYDDKEFDGIGFREVLLILISDCDQNTATIRMNINPANHNIELFGDPMLQHNAQRVAAGEPPLTYAEFETFNIESNEPKVSH